MYGKGFPKMVRQLQHTLKGIKLKIMKNEIIRKLINAIVRSEYAYSKYKENKKYFQALRIKNANLVVYNLLQEYILISEDSDVLDVCNYIFHLEDWFAQFNVREQLNPNLEDVFVFDRLEGSLPFPKEFTEKLKKI